MNPSFNGALQIAYFEQKRARFREYVSTALVLIVGLAVGVSGLVLIFSRAIGGGTGLGTIWLLFAVVTAASQAILAVFMGLLQIREQTWAFGFLQIVTAILNVLLTFLLVLVFQFQWEGRVIAIMVSSVLVGVGSFIFWGLVREGIRLNFDRAIARELLAFGIPLIPHMLSAWILTAVDRLFLNGLVGLSATGVYTVGQQVSSIIMVSTVTFNQAWVPYLYRTLNSGKDDEKRKIVRLTYIYFFAIMVFALLVGLVAPWILGILVGDRFLMAAEFIRWIAVGYAFNGAYYMVTNYLFFRKRTGLLSYVSTTSALVSVIGNVVLIRLNGAIGAAQAGVLSFAIMFLLTWAMAARVQPMPWWPGWGTFRRD